jgi:hypothetical protein
MFLPKLYNQSINYQYQHHYDHSTVEQILVYNKTGISEDQKNETSKDDFFRELDNMFRSIGYDKVNDLNKWVKGDWTYEYMSRGTRYSFSRDEDNKSDVVMVMDFTLTHKLNIEGGACLFCTFGFQIPFFVETGKELLADGKKVYQKTLINPVITNIENTAYSLLKHLIKERKHV